MSGEGSREALRLKQLRGKKERLGYAVERLVLQAQQKERQLRVSDSHSVSEFSPHDHPSHDMSFG